MFKGIIFKEWIKLRWFLILYAMFALLVMGYVFLKVRHDMLFNEPKSYWYSVLFQGYQFFRFLKFVPLAGGILVAVAQFFPETVNKRIKLTFHLPRKENAMLLTMIGFGTASLLVVYLIVFGLFILGSAHFFPAEITLAASVTLVPWFLSGLAAYFLGALVILEPVWLYRFLYFAAAGAFLPFFLKAGVSGSYLPLLLPLAVIVALLSISLLFSGYRFRKGEM
jgi:hypothetical protein